MNKLIAHLLATLCLAGSLASNAADQPVQLWDERTVRVRPGITVRAVVHLTVGEGYFLVGAGARDERLQALTLKLERVHGVTLGKPVYPKAAPVKLAAAADAVPAYSGVVTLGVPIKVSAKAEWTKQIVFGTIAYQACSVSRCLEPATLPVNLEVEVAGK